MWPWQKAAGRGSGPRTVRCPCPLVLLLALRLCDAVIILPNGGVLQRFDRGRDTTVILPDGRVIEEFNWPHGDYDLTPRGEGTRRRWRTEDEEERPEDGD